MATLGEIVRAVRTERRLTLAECARVTGICEASISSVEYGGRYTKSTLEKLARFLEREPKDLDPENLAMERRHPRSRSIADPSAPAALGRVLEQLVVLHSEFNAAHVRVLNALRIGDSDELASARARQAWVMSEQGDAVESYQACCRSGAGTPTEGAKPTLNARGLNGSRSGRAGLQ